MTRKTRIKIGILVVVTLVLCFSDRSFAAEDTGRIGSIAWILNFIISILSWIWVVFANLAGKFLTNNWVYGQALGIDVLLWKYWNIVKNMSNFCLGFYLMYVIFKGLIGQSKGKEGIVENLKKVLLRVLVAGVGIQASWFLTSVVIDLSTITLSAVGSFPSQIISMDEYTEKAINTSLNNFFNDEETNGKIYDLFPKNGAANSFTEIKDVPMEGTVSRDKLIDALMPNKDDVSGPLYYMGFAILRTQDINSIKSYNGLQGAKRTILNLIIQGGTTIIYSIEVGVLCVIALMRILYLWMFIVLSPFAILLACVKRAGEKELLGNGFVADLMKQINLKTFIAKVFQPAIIVLGISLSMIFVTLMSKIVNNDSTRSMNNFDIGGAKITTLKEEDSIASNDVTYITSLEGNLLKFSISSVGKGILDFMMSIITVILVYLIIKISIKISNKIGDGQDFLSKRVEKLNDGVGSLMKSVPVIPVAGYDENGQPKTRYITTGQIPNLLESKVGRYQKKVNEEYSRQNEMLNSLMGNNVGSLSADELTKIENTIKLGSTQGLGKLRQVKLDISGMRDAKGKGMTLNPQTASNAGFWISQFEKWLEDSKNGQPIIGTGNDLAWNDMIKWWNDDKNKDVRTLENMFDKVKGSVQAYAQFFFDQDDDRYNIISWSKLMDADISKQKQSK